MTMSADRSIKGHFSAEDAAAIREAIAADRIPLGCPKCHQPLRSSLPG